VIGAKYSLWVVEDGWPAVNKGDKVEQCWEAAESEGSFGAAEAVGRVLGEGVDFNSDDEGGGTPVSVGSVQLGEIGVRRDGRVREVEERQNEGYGQNLLSYLSNFPVLGKGGSVQSMGEGYMEGREIEMQKVIGEVGKVLSCSCPAGLVIGRQVDGVGPLKIPHVLSKEDTGLDLEVDRTVLGFPRVPGFGDGLVIWNILMGRLRR